VSPTLGPDRDHRDRLAELADTGVPVRGPLFDFAPAIDEYLKTHLFGDIFERDSVDWQSRELATAAAATGHQIRRLTCPRRLTCDYPCAAWMVDAGVHSGELVMVLAWACSAAMADEGPSPAVTRVTNTTLTAQAGEAGVRHLGLGSTLGELLRHPAFAGYARRLLPRDDVAIDDALPIERIGSLLPYHSHVVPDVVLDALNYLIDEVGRGTPVFHELYTPAEQQGIQRRQAPPSSFSAAGPARPSR
jgi:hypothetical protein